MMYSLNTLFLLLGSVSFVCAATVEVYWDITWVNAAPDGYSRPVIGINGEWPCPLLEANVGDTVIVHVDNQLGNETTGIHFHGINQLGTPEMDGPSSVTQCSIPPGSSVTYQWLADAPGTYWYHSHQMGQYPDGLRGPMVIHDPQDPYAGQVDEEVILTCTDWYHSQTIPLVQAMLQPSNTQFRPPLPDSILINEGGNTRIPFDKGKTYRFRMISFSAFGACLVHFQNHTMQVIMQDGSYVTQAEASQIYLSPGQRYDVLISAADTDSGNYPFLFSLDVNPDFRAPTLPLGFPYNQTGYLVTDPSQNSTAVDVVHVWNPVDSTLFTNPAGEGPLGPVGTSIKLDVSFCFDNNSIPRSCLNGKPYVPQRVPTLYSAATTGEDNANPAIYGGVNPFIAPGGEIIEIVLNNLDTGSHPFHLHGHQFQVLAAPASNSGSFSGDTSNFPANPAYKDVFLVNAKSHAVIRFRADNPGAWLFHCHNEWHVEMGLTATVIEDPPKLRGLTFPQDHIDVCKAIGQPYQGNAAGNTQNYTDTAGMLFVNPPTYTGALYEPTATPKPRSRIVRTKL